MQLGSGVAVAVAEAARCGLQPPALESHRPSSPIFPLKTVTAEQTPQGGLWTRVHLIPRLPAFLSKVLFLSMDSCLSSYWLLSSEQVKLSLTTG